MKGKGKSRMLSICIAAFKLFFAQRGLFFKKPSETGCTKFILSVMGTLGGWFLNSSFCLFFFILLFTHIFIVAVFNVLKAFSTLLPTMSQGNSNAYRCPSKNKIFFHNFNLKNFLLFHNLLNRYFLVYIKNGGGPYAYIWLKKYSLKCMANISFVLFLKFDQYLCTFYNSSEKCVWVISTYAQFNIFQLNPLGNLLKVEH